MSDRRFIEAVEYYPFDGVDTQSGRVEDKQANKQTKQTKQATCSRGPVGSWVCGPPAASNAAINQTSLKLYTYVHRLYTSAARYSLLQTNHKNKNKNKNKEISSYVHTQVRHRHTQLRVELWTYNLRARGGAYITDCGQSSCSQSVTLTFFEYKASPRSSNVSSKSQCERGAPRNAAARAACCADADAGVDGMASRRSIEWLF